ncbi:DUF2076 family protein [Buchnera aphidicola (Pseudoregma panicola)]|uniref:DUF2076 domain-containing protein n=1 Tax=Buchnera aphidicola TaxID=9 RepID=UPI0031B6D9B3
MNSEERNLIKNLFKKIDNIEKKFSKKDNEANDLILDLMKKNPNSHYYIVQSLLVQDEVILRLNNNIIDLKKKIEELKTFKKKTKRSFLSNFFNFDKKDSPKKNNINNNSENINNKDNSSNYDYNHKQSCFSGYQNNGSFLGNALQTAAGVAGGIAFGNLLTSLFHSNRYDQPIINDVHNTNFFNLEENSKNSLESNSITEEDNLVDNSDISKFNNLDRNNFEKNNFDVENNDSLEESEENFTENDFV